MVNTICSVIGCNRESYPGCGISFHRLPTNTEIKKKWIEAIPGKVTNNSVVCSLHFKPEDYLTKARKKLKSGVVPSIFPEAEWGEEYLEEDEPPLSEDSDSGKEEDLHQLSLNTYKPVEWGEEYLEEDEPPLSEDSDSGKEEDLHQLSLNAYKPVIPENKKINVPSVIQLLGSENVEPRKSEGPPCKKVRLQEVSTQTDLSPVTTPREEELKRELKKMKQQIKRRDVKINNLKSLLNIIHKREV